MYIVIGSVWLLVHFAKKWKFETKFVFSHSSFNVSCTHAILEMDS